MTPASAALVNPYTFNINDDDSILSRLPQRSYQIDTNNLFSSRTLNHEASIESDTQSLGSVLRFYTSTINEDFTENYIEKQKNFEKLNVIEGFEDSWDAHSAEKFDAKIINSAWQLIDKLHYQPDLFPTGRSTIQLEYENHKKYLEFEIYSDRIQMYFEENQISAEEKNVEIEDVLSEVERFYAVK